MTLYSMKTDPFQLQIGLAEKTQSHTTFTITGSDTPASRFDRSPWYSATPIRSYIPSSLWTLCRTSTDVHILGNCLFWRGCSTCLITLMFTLLPRLLLLVIHHHLARSIRESIKHTAQPTHPFSLNNQTPNLKYSQAYIPASVQKCDTQNPISNLIR